VQAAARQILKPAELRVKAAGFDQILGAYDEIVCEVPEGEADQEKFKEAMVGEPAGDWYADWPIRADVWKGPVYTK